MASTDSSGPTLDELLQFISDTVVEHFAGTNQRTDGAYLAEVIRAKWVGFSFEQVGLNRLSDAVRAAEEKGLVTRHRDVKHLQLSPGPETGVTKSTSVTPDQSGKPQYVRPDIWRAFALFSPGQVNYLDTKTHEIVSRPATSPAFEDPEAETRFIAVDPIPLEDQRCWMKNFVDSKEFLNAQDAPIEDSRCYVRFPEWIERFSTELAREWRQFRTQQVVAFIKSWGHDKGVNTEEFFVRAGSHRDDNKRFRTLDKEKSTERDAVIAAIQEMSLEELGRLAIPVQYVLRHFKPR